MPARTNRVLDPTPVESIEAHIAAGGLAGLRRALASDPADIRAVVDASGLRGRGGAGFPTGRKWQTIAAHDSTVGAPHVVVNGAEGEPGSFKDRTLLRRNPFRVIEGALIAAHAVGADRVTVAVKDRFTTERERLAEAVSAFEAVGVTGDVRVEVFAGPDAYLFGEETALLEALAGRPPFPRVAPPWRHGAGADEGDSPWPADSDLGGEDPFVASPPTLVNNVETMAHVAQIVDRGADWFRETGTSESPGTIVCTVSGDVGTAGVGEFPMGTPLRTVLHELGGPADAGREIRAVVSGVSNALLTAKDLDVPLTHEDVESIGSGLGAAGFLVFDDDTDPVAVAAGISRFLAVESCGQCTPCKQDGQAVALRLGRLRDNEPEPEDLVEIDSLLGTVTDGARCFLATQQQLVTRSLLDTFGDHAVDHVDGRLPAADPVLIAPIEDIVDGRARLSSTQQDKQPDWRIDAEPSGQAPADRLRRDRPADAPSSLDDR